MLDKNLVENAVLMFQTRWCGKCDPVTEDRQEQDMLVQSTIDDLLDYLDRLPDGAPVELEDIDRGIFLLEDYVEEDLQGPVQRFKKELYNAAAD